MAYMTNIHCMECGENKTVAVGAGQVPELICGACQGLKDAERREEYFASLDKLPLEERIRKIEEWIYEYRPTHVPPPIY